MYWTGDKIDVNSKGEHVRAPGQKGAISDTRPKWFEKRMEAMTR